MQDRRRGIHTPVLFISGTPDSDAVLKASLLPRTAFLTKPFTIERFHNAIQNLYSQKQKISSQSLLIDSPSRLKDFLRPGI